MHRGRRHADVAKSGEEQHTRRPADGVEVSDVDSEVDMVMLASGPNSPRDTDTASPPTEGVEEEPEVSPRSRPRQDTKGEGEGEGEEDEGEEEDEEEIDWEAIAADAPSRRTRTACARAAVESRGSALRTRRALGTGSHQAATGAASTTRASAAASTSGATAEPSGGISRVLVVGAGYAGIAAARTLTDLGYKASGQRTRARSAVYHARVRKRCEARFTVMRAALPALAHNAAALRRAPCLLCECTHGPSSRARGRAAFRTLTRSRVALARGGAPHAARRR